MGGTDTCKENITDFYVSDCPQLNPVDLLSEIITAQSSQETHTLKRIRAIWDEFTYDTGGATILDNIVKLADGTYSGLDAHGVAIANSYPTLEGTLNINTTCYEDTVTALMNKFTQLNLNITGAYYLRFADATVQSICATNWGDGTGITKAQCAAVSSIGTKFKGNTTISSFNEFVNFTNLNELASEVFRACSNLSAIMLPSTIKIIRDNAFNGCNFIKFIIPDTITGIGSYVFSWNKSITTFISYPTIPPSTGNIFTTVPNIYVPDASVDTYKNASGWSQYASKIKALSTFTE